MISWWSQFIHVCRNCHPHLKFAFWGLLVFFLLTSIYFLFISYPTNAISTVTWTERLPAGDVNKFWKSVASDDYGTNLIAALDVGRLYTSSNSGVTWTEPH